MSDDQDQDDAAFRDAVRDARPLKTARRVRPSTRPPPLARFREADELEALSESRSADRETLERHAGDAIDFRRDHVAPRTLKRLRRGQFRIDDELDLHGLTRMQARDEVVAFLERARRHGARVVRIVHGKGRGSGQRGPVLKAAVAAWLARRGDVLAYTSARLADRGTGALLVLLASSSD